MIYSNQKNVQSFSLGWQGWVLELQELRTPYRPQILKKKMCEILHLRNMYVYQSTMQKSAVVIITIR